VAWELTQVLSAPTAVLTEPYDGVQSLTSGSSAEQAQAVYIEAADAIDTIPNSITHPYLRQLASSHQPLTLFWAVTALLRIGDSDYLDAVAPLLINPPFDEERTIHSLATAMKGHTSVTQLIPTLTILLGSIDVGIRRVAAFSLQEIGTRDVIKPLATMALKDADGEVRYRAVCGLSKATGSDVPSKPLFKQGERAYISSWEAWAKSNVK
jgi:HEAT repeat protein